MNEKLPPYFDRIIELTQTYIQNKSYEITKQGVHQALIEEQIENIVKFMKGITQALKEVASGE